MYFGFRHNAFAKILIILHKTKKKEEKVSKDGHML